MLSFYASAHCCALRREEDGTKRTPSELFFRSGGAFNNFISQLDFARQNFHGALMRKKVGFSGMAVIVIVGKLHSQL